MYVESVYKMEKPNADQGERRFKEKFNIDGVHIELKSDLVAYFLLQALNLQSSLNETKMSEQQSHCLHLDYSFELF